jgi:hypothetical protein
MASRQATARQIEYDVEPASGEETRRRWVNATSQLETGALAEPFAGFEGFDAPSRARRAPALAAEPAPARATSTLTYRPAGTALAPRATAAPAPRFGLPAERLRLASLAVAGVAGLLALYVVLTALFGFARTKLDDMQYGRPRTTHLDAYVGHAGEQAGAPSHFIAMNLDRRVVLIELPGGDTQNATTITGPYLFGDGQDLTPIKLASEDVNGDGQADLLVTVQNEQLVYINDKAKNSFHLMTPEERAKLPAASASTGGSPGQ